MNPEHLSELIIAYRYWILIPLSFIEGPVVAFVAGALASLHYFNIAVLAAIFFIRDIGLDVAYYALGYFCHRAGFVQRILKKLRITEGHLDGIRRLWNRHPLRTMFIGKLSYGIAMAFIVVAGMIKMPFGRFLKYGSVVAVAQYGTLLLLGYFLGSAFSGTVLRIIQSLEYVLLGGAILTIGYYIFSLRIRREFLKEEKKAEEEIETEKN